MYLFSSFNFKEAFVSSVRKTSHNVLKKQKARYLYRNKSCKSYFIPRFIIALSHTSLNRLEDTALDRHQSSDKKATCLTGNKEKFCEFREKSIKLDIFVNSLRKKHFYTLKQQWLFLISFYSFEGERYFWVKLCIFLYKLPSVINQQLFASLKVISDKDL